MELKNPFSYFSKFQRKLKRGYIGFLTEIMNKIIETVNKEKDCAIFQKLNLSNLIIFHHIKFKR